MDSFIIPVYVQRIVPIICFGMGFVSPLSKAILIMFTSVRLLFVLVCTGAFVGVLGLLFSIIWFFSPDTALRIWRKFDTSF